jgi:rod shape-determining protein MreB
MVRSVEIKGRDAVTGAPQKATLTSKEMIEAMAAPAAAIINAIEDVLAVTPEALLADIMQDSVMLCGGASLVYGFGRLITKATGVPVRSLKDPALTCVMGAARALQLPKGQEMTPGPIRLERQIKRRQGKSDASGTREEQ